MELQLGGERAGTHFPCTRPKGGAWSSVRDKLLGARALAPTGQGAVSAHLRQGPEPGVLGPGTSAEGTARLAACVSGLWHVPPVSS